MFWNVYNVKLFNVISFHPQFPDARQSIPHECIHIFEHIDRQIQSVTEHISSEMRVQHSQQQCTMCGGQMDPQTSFVKAPKIILVIPCWNCNLCWALLLMGILELGLVRCSLVFLSSFTHFQCAVLHWPNGIYCPS